MYGHERIVWINRKTKIMSPIATDCQKYLYYIIGVTVDLTTVYKLKSFIH